ncbi:MAG: CrcB family protein [Tannerellaceae bacterium]|jgi:CrcB protein|nr:CrcB family protein [Tannerellaceae bacterium]
MLRLLALAGGGALGTLLRYGVTVWLGRLTPGFPYGVLTVNVVGSFFIGLCWGLCDAKGGSSLLGAFLFVGVFGGFTTFSSFSLDTMALIRAGEGRMAILNIVLNNVLGLGAAFAGGYLARRLGA